MRGKRQRSVLAADPDYKPPEDMPILRGGSEVPLILSDKLYWEPDKFVATITAKDFLIYTGCSPTSKFIIHSMKTNKNLVFEIYERDAPNGRWCYKSDSLHGWRVVLTWDSK